MHEELNASTLRTDARVEEPEEHGEEEEQAQEQEEQRGPSRMQPKSPGKKRIPVTYPDDVAMNTPHLYNKEHEGYLLGQVSLYTTGSHTQYTMKCYHTHSEGTVTSIVVSMSLSLLLCTQS